MIWTLDEAKVNLATWKEAYMAASSGKAYTIEGRSLTRQDLPQIKKELQYWADTIAELTGQRTRSRVGSFVIVDR